MKRMLGKLKNTIGESIGETLVALLISALALTMLAGAISAATRVVMTSRDSMLGYYKKDKEMVKSVVSADSTGSIMIKSTSDQKDPAINQNANVCYTQNDTFESMPVTVYVLPTPTPTPTI